MKRKIPFDSVPVPGWLFVTLTVAYDELLLHLWTAETLFAGRLLAVLAFGAGFGVLLGLLISLLPGGRAVKWAAVIAAFLENFLCLLAYFISDAYQVFMTPATIFGGAGGVARDFLHLVLSLLARNLWRIGLVLLPTVLYILFCRCEKTGWKRRCVLAALGAGLYLLGFGAVNGLTADAPRFGAAYDFDSAIRSFGLNMGLALELRHGTGGGKEPVFEAPQPEPVPEVPSMSKATEEAVIWADNALDLDFAALAQEAPDASTASICQYLDTLAPAKQNEKTGLFAGKNLILITAEAFAGEVIDPHRTPTLFRMATRGIRFNDYYQPAWGASTTSGEFSNTVGLVPTNGGMCMKEVLQQNFFLTMGHQLQRQGYYSAAYHNHNKDFYDRDKTHTHLGYDRFLAQYGGLEGITPVWPESDLEMMEATIPQYIDHQPFSIYYMTVSGHCMYSLNANAMAKKHYDEVADMDCSEAVKCYYASQLELEAAMTYLLEQLEEAGIADDTVVVISSDHYPYGLERSGTWENTSDYLAELYGVDRYDNFIRDHNALIIWSGCLEDRNLTVEEPVYSLDILPTLSNLFGLPYDSRLLVGRDVFSEETPLVLWPDFSWKTDKGLYNAQTGVFTPAEGVQTDETYLKNTSLLVRNKITYSRSVLDTDFFNFLSKELDLEQSQKQPS